MQVLCIAPSTPSGGVRAIGMRDDVWIGTGCKAVKLGTTGFGSVNAAAAGSIIGKYIPPDVVAGGNSAQVLKDSRSKVVE